MNTNTNIKQGYKQTSLGILPQEWEVVRLGEVGDIVGGGTPDTTNSAFWNGEIAWISSSDIDEESIYKISIRRFINEFAIKNSATNLIPAKSVLIISRVGVGKVAVNEIPLCTSQDTQSLILKNAHYIFMAYLIKYNIKTLLQYNQGTSIQGFTKTELKSLQIPLPPLTEQEKIAQILSVWDKGISVLKSLIEAKTKRKKALMQRLLTPPCESPTPSLRASETSAAIHNKSVDCHDLTASNLAMTEKNSKAKQSLRFAEFTDKWQEMRLGDICENRRGSFPQPYGLKKWYGGDEAMPFVQVIDIDENLRLKSKTKQTISKLAQPKSVFVHKNTILSSIQGSIGRVALTQYDCYADRTIAIFTNLKPHIDSIFFLSWKISRFAV